ncbi:MAG: hypothetical protein WED00_09855 [Aquisalimonadaceae bacterium]
MAATTEHLLEPRVAREREQLRARLETTLDLPHLYQTIDSDPNLTGAGVVYMDGKFNVVELRKFEPLCRMTPIKVIIRESPESVSPQQFASDLQEDKLDSHIVAEALGATLACTGAVLSWLVVSSGTIAIPFSGGASAAVTVIGISAASASTIQCVNSVGRIAAEFIDPNINDHLDNQTWYTNTAKALDFVSLTGAGTSALTTVRMVKMTKAASSRSMIDILRGLTRAERTRLTKELIRIQNPRISNSMLKAVQRGGRVPKRLTAPQVRRATITQVRDALSSAFAFAGSTTSGTVSSFGIGVYEEAQ